MGGREIFGMLLVDSPSASVRGTCNHTGKRVDGSVLVADTLEPDRYDAIVGSSAVICGGGGRTGHMESLCRSRGIPVLRVDRAELDGIAGLVTLDLTRQSVVLGEAEPAAEPVPSFAGVPPELRSICVVVADATDVQATNALTPAVEQVTSFFVREEFCCLAAGLSPLDALGAGPGEAQRYGVAVGEQLCAIAKDLLPGQRLVARLLDLRSDDAAKLTRHVDVAREPNPDLGMHGARWLLADDRYPLAFRAMRTHVRERLGAEAARVSFAVPFVNDADEFVRLRVRCGLSDDTPMAVFVETPAAVHSVPDFCAAGAAELFVGTKDLAQFYLAADRSNHLVADSYRTDHPAVVAALGEVVAAAGRAGTPVHVFSLLADLDQYVRDLTPDGFMMCAAELRRLAMAPTQ